MESLRNKLKNLQKIVDIFLSAIEKYSDSFPKNKTLESIIAGEHPVDHHVLSKYELNRLPVPSYLTHRQ
jgi:hypothetical protein